MAALKRRVHLELLARWLPEFSHMRVLKTDLWEEGIAGDELLFTLARQGVEAYGVDVSRRIVEVARRMAQDLGVRVGLKRGDLRALPLEDGSMDAIISTSTIDHLECRDRPRALAELRRVIVPGGVLVLTVDNELNLGDPLIRLASWLGAIPFPLAPGASLGSMRNLLAEAGFRPSDHEFIVHGPRVLTTVLVRAARALPGRTGQRAVRGLLRALEGAGRRWPERSGAFIAVRAVAPRN